VNNITSKEPKTLSQLANRLQKRGLTNRKGIDIEKYLFDMNYYRLSGYWRYYQVDPLRGQKDFTHKIDIADIKALVDLDVRLRCLILEGIQIFEPVLRGHICHEFAHRLGTYSYLDKDMYIHGKQLPNSINSNIQESKDQPCIRHYINKGDKVPVWTAVEVITMGTLVKMFHYCKDTDCKQEITKKFNLNRTPKQLNQTLRALVSLRNLSSHHARLWNRYVKVSPALPKFISKEYPSAEEHSMMPSLILLMNAVDKSNGNNSYSERMMSLIDSNSEFRNGIYSPQPNKVRWNKSEL
jgi:abortive infection bacteriophage resistance protein